MPRVGAQGAMAEKKDIQARLRRTHRRAVAERARARDDRAPQPGVRPLVWGPELECDHDTDEFGYMADLCNGPW